MRPVEPKPAALKDLSGMVSVNKQDGVVVYEFSQESGTGGSGTGSKSGVLVKDNTNYKTNGLELEDKVEVKKLELSDLPVVLINDIISFCDIGELETLCSVNREFALLAEEQRALRFALPLIRCFHTKAAPRLNKQTFNAVTKSQCEGQLGVGV